MTTHELLNRYMEKRAEETGMSLTAYQTYVLAWNRISEQEDLPFGFLYEKHNALFVEARAKKDPRILLGVLEIEAAVTEGAILGVKEK